MIRSNIPVASLATLLATLVATAVHHVFRLGPSLIAPSLIGLTLPLVLFALYRRTGRRALLWLYAGYAALVVFWFGFLDGFLDHVAKAAGLDNITFLPGSEADVITTAFTLWSQTATTNFYEGTGILSAILAFLTLITTSAFVYGSYPAAETTKPHAT
jgi:hypothetical protein